MSESNENPRRLWDREIEAKEISIFTPLERFNQSAASREAYGFTNQELQAVVPQLEAMKSVATDFLWRLQVKRTPELPYDGRYALFWNGNEWVYAERIGRSWRSGADYYDIKDGQYWLPLPTFDPREVQG